DLGRRMPLRLSLRLAGLVARSVQDLGALAFALLTEALDLVLALLQLTLTSADLLLGAADLRRRGCLCVALDRVSHVGGGANHVQRVHPDGVPARLHLSAASRSLQHTQLHLKLRRVAPKGLESLLDALGLVAAIGERRQLLDVGERR